MGRIRENERCKVGFGKRIMHLFRIKCSNWLSRCILSLRTCKFSFSGFRMRLSTSSYTSHQINMEVRAAKGNTEFLILFIMAKNLIHVGRGRKRTTCMGDTWSYRKHSRAKPTESAHMNHA